MWGRTRHKVGANSIGGERGAIRSDIDSDPSSYRKIMMAPIKVRGGKIESLQNKKCELYTVHLQVEYLFMAKLIFFYPFACACISETGDPNTC